MILFEFIRAVFNVRERFPVNWFKIIIVFRFLRRLVHTATPLLDAMRLFFFFFYEQSFDKVHTFEIAVVDSVTMFMLCRTQGRIETFCAPLRKPTKNSELFFFHKHTNVLL